MRSEPVRAARRGFGPITHRHPPNVGGDDIDARAAPYRARRFSARGFRPSPGVRYLSVAQISRGPSDASAPRMLSRRHATALMR